MTDSHEEPRDTAAGPALTRNTSERQSPGEILREGRLAHDYTVEDLCAQTKLPAKTVNALEDNDLNALSQPVFARGYYRQCAKVLDIDPARLMSAYDAWAGQIEPRRPAPVTSVYVVPQDVTPGRGFRVRGLLIAVVLIVVVFIGVFVLLPHSNRPGSTDAASTNDNGTTTQLLSGGNNGGNTTDNTDASTEDGMADYGSAAGSGTPKVAGSNGTPTTGQAAGGRNVNQTLGINPPNPVGNAGPGPQGGNGNAASSVPSNQLTLTFNKRSWVQVTDATGNRMASGLFESGDSKEFNGKPPYKITLGFAPGVDVSIGGQKVDVAGQTGSGSIAHLTVDAPAAGSTSQGNNG